MFTLSIDFDSKFKQPEITEPILNSKQEEMKLLKKKANIKQKSKKISKNDSPSSNTDEKTSNPDKNYDIKENQKKTLKTKEKSDKIEKKNKNYYYIFDDYKLILIHQKLKKKYQSIPQFYNLKKINELIYNIHSKFTMSFKEYLLKDENSDFLKRFYKKNEIKIKLKKIFFFYAKYSKTYPNYIIIPEGQFMYKNILKKQKMIDKLQKIKDEETENKNNALEISNNTIFSSNAIDSIYNLKESVNLNNLEEIFDLGLNLDDSNQIKKVSNIIKLIKNSEFSKNKNHVFSKKKQTIYKKELSKRVNELSKSYYKLTNNLDNFGEDAKYNIEEPLTSNTNENEIYKTHKLLTQKFGDPIITLGDDFENEKFEAEKSPIYKYKKLLNSGKSKKSNTTSKLNFTYVKGKNKLKSINKISSQNHIINEIRSNNYATQTYDGNGYQKVFLTESINDIENNKPIYKKLNSKIHLATFKTVSSFTPSSNTKRIFEPQKYLYVKKSCNDNHGKTLADFYKNKMKINSIDYNNTISSSLSKTLRRPLIASKLEKNIYSHIKRKFFQNREKNFSERKKINYGKNNENFRNNSIFTNKFIGRNSIQKHITRHNTNLTSSNLEEFIDKENDIFSSGKIKKLAKKKHLVKMIKIDSPIYEKSHKIKKTKSLAVSSNNFEEIKNEKKNEYKNSNKAPAKTYKKMKAKNKK